MTDWMQEAAKEIVSMLDVHGAITGSESDVQAVLLKHMPFKLGVKYMEVPRCETCKFWDQDAPGSVSGTCERSYKMPDRIWSNYSGSDVKTDPRFGCVEWRAKA